MKIHNSKLDLILNALIPAYIENQNYITQDALYEIVKNGLKDKNEFQLYIRILHDKNEITFHDMKISIKRQALHKMSYGGYSINEIQLFWKRYDRVIITLGVLLSIALLGIELKKYSTRKEQQILPEVTSHQSEPIKRIYPKKDSAIAKDSP